MELKEYTIANYPLTKFDLCTIFMDIALSLIKNKGYFAMINQSSWANKSSYNTYRLWLKNNANIATYLDLGSGTFDELNGEVVQSLCFSIMKTEATDGLYFNLSSASSSDAKNELFHSVKDQPYIFSLDSISKIPDYKICYWISKATLSAFLSGTAINQKYPVKKD